MEQNSQSPSQEMHLPSKFRLFGNLYLEAPALFLSAKDLEDLEKLLPHLRELESRSSGGLPTEEWRYEQEFELFVDRETRAWREHDVDRDSRFLIRPSGPLDALVSCHLHCPSFSVADPYCRDTADPTNVCIKQLLDIGFSPTQCLIYDNLLRREALDGFQFYPPNILCLHESFIHDLRKHMSSIVDVCWGVAVKEWMKKNHNLTQLRLWGQFDGAEIWLEWGRNDDNMQQPWRIDRFVVFLHHPQRMLYGSRQIRGSRQDLHLAMIAGLANINIDKEFYQTTHKPGTYGKLAAWQYKRQQALNATAISQVATAISDASAFPCPPNESTADELPLPTSFLEFKMSLSGGRNHEDEREKEAHIADYEIPIAKLMPELGSPSFQKGLHFLASSLISAGASLPEAMLLSGLSTSAGPGSAAISEWEDLPKELREWIQAQDGLKTDRAPICSSSDLVYARRLLCRKQPRKEAMGEDLMTVALDLSRRYFKQIVCIGRDKSKIDDLIITKAPPHHVMPRKCGLCNQRILDDARARYKRLEPEKYVVRFLQNGCGVPGCPADRQGTWAVPADCSVQFTRQDKAALTSKPMKAAWEDYFILRDTAASSLPAQVKIQCQRCHSQIFEDRMPRWTNETTPRYISRRPNCSACGKGVNWCPVDETVLWVDSSKLSRKWTSLVQNEGFDPDDVRKNPDWYIPNGKRKTAESKSIRS